MEFIVETSFEITLIPEIHTQQRKYVRKNVLLDVFYNNSPSFIDIFRGEWLKFFMYMNLFMDSVWFICSEKFLLFFKRKICTGHCIDKPYTKHNCQPLLKKCTVKIIFEIVLCPEMCTKIKNFRKYSIFENLLFLKNLFSNIYFISIYLEIHV